MYWLSRSQRPVEQAIRNAWPLLSNIHSYIPPDTLLIASPNNSSSILNLFPSQLPNINSFVLLKTGSQISRSLAGYARPWNRDIPRVHAWNVVDYTKAINRCLKQDSINGLRRAEALFDEMKTSGIEPDVVTYISMMQGYSRSGLTEQLHNIYAEMLRTGIEPTEVTFTILIHSCAQNKNLERALGLFLEMKASCNSTPNVIAYNALLNVCAKSKNLERAKTVYEEMIQLGMDVDSFTLSTMIDAYAACSHVANCPQHFRECRAIVRDAVRYRNISLDTQIYNALLKLCSRGGLVERALQLHSTMKRKSIWSTSQTYTSLLSTCATAGDIATAEKIWEEIKTVQPAKTVNVVNAMINVYAECIDRDDFQKLLDRCLKLVRSAEAEGIASTAWTFNSLIKLCTRGAAMTEAMSILGQMKRRGMRPSVVTYNSLIDGYAKAIQLTMDEVVVASTAIVEEMKENNIAADVATFTALINLSLALRDLDRARRYLRQMHHRGIKPNAITYGALIKCYEKLGDPKDGDAYLRPILDLYDELKAKKFSVDDHGYTSIISACAKASDLTSACRIWEEMKESGISMTVISYCAMINAYLKGGAYDQAVGLLDEMESTNIAPNTVVFRSFFLHYLRMADGSHALDMIKRMRKCGLKMDDECNYMLKELKLI